MQVALSLPQQYQRRTNVTTMSSKKKGYAFGFIGNNHQEKITAAVPPASETAKKQPPSPLMFGGKVLASQSISNAIYKENVDENKYFKSAFVYEFPSLHQAKAWYHHHHHDDASGSRTSNSSPTESLTKKPSASLEAATTMTTMTTTTTPEDDGILVVMEGDEYGDEFHGFSLFFIKVEDKEKFATYNPNESLKHYKSKRNAIKIVDAPIFVSGVTAATNSTEHYDMAVLIGFRTANEGKTWLESNEYKYPHGILRMETTSGYGIIISSSSK